MKSYKLFGPRPLFTSNAGELLPLVTCDELPRVGDTLSFELKGQGRRALVVGVVRVIAPYVEGVSTEVGAEVYVGELS